jgi:transposase
MRRGQQKCIPAPGVQQRHHVFAAYSWRDDTVTWTTADERKSVQFIAFLEHLLVERYPTGRLVLVLDNAPIHTSGASRAALSLFDHRVLIFWLPKYCSTLNPIERYWRHLKDTICVNKLFPSLEDLVDAVEHELIRQNDLNHKHRFSFLKPEV